MAMTTKPQVTTPEKFAEDEREKEQRTVLEHAVFRVEGRLSSNHFHGQDSRDNHYTFDMGFMDRETLEELKGLYEAIGWKAGFSCQSMWFRPSTFMLWLHD